MGILKDAKKQYDEEISKRITQLIEELMTMANEIDDEQLYDEYCDLIGSINTAHDVISDALMRL